MSLGHGASEWDSVALGDATCDHPGDDNPYFNRCWAYWSDYRRLASGRRRSPDAEPTPAHSASSDEAKWREALDEATASVTWEEYRRLTDECRRLKRPPSAVSISLEEAFKSIGRLWASGLSPRYDAWDALLYVSWYQARQIHLVCAVLEQHPPPRSGKPLRVVDVGCGAWAVPIALAMLEARGHPALLDRDVSVHGIERADPMTRIGQKLWLEFGCAAEARGLPIDFFEMIDEDSTFTSVNEYPDSPARDASAEAWLLAIHALYEESQPEIGRFLAKFRTRHVSRLRYELLTTDGSESKRQILESIIVKGSGERLGPPQPSRLTPVWNDVLIETTKCRRKIHKELRDSGIPMSDKHMGYLWNAVAWNPSNPIQQDAIWVRKAVP